MNIINFLAGEKPFSPSIARLSIVSIIVAREEQLPDSSTCFSDGSECVAEFDALKIDNRKEKTSVIIEELKSKGFHVPDLPEAS